MFSLEQQNLTDEQLQREYDGHPDTYPIESNNLFPEILRRIGVLVQAFINRYFPSKEYRQSKEYEAMESRTKSIVTKMPPIEDLEFIDSEWRLLQKELNIQKNERSSNGRAVKNSRIGSWYRREISIAWAKDSKIDSQNVVVDFICNFTQRE